MLEVLYLLHIIQFLRERRGGSMIGISSVVTQSCPTLCDPMDCTTPGFPVHHLILDLAQTHAHRVGDAIQPSHPLLSLYPPSFNHLQIVVFPISQFFASGGQSLDSHFEFIQSFRLETIFANILTCQVA